MSAQQAGRRAGSENRQQPLTTSSGTTNNTTFVSASGAGQPWSQQRQRPPKQEQHQPKQEQHQAPQRPPQHLVTYQSRAAEQGVLTAEQKVRREELLQKVEGILKKFEADLRSSIGNPVDGQSTLQEHFAAARDESMKRLRLHINSSNSQFGVDVCAELNRKMEYLAQRIESELALVHRNQRMSKTGTASKAVGIDLGTTYCSVAVYENGEVRSLRCGENRQFTMPSIVFYGEDGTLVGSEEAKRMAHKIPENFMRDMKRIIGRRYDDDFFIKFRASSCYYFSHNGGMAAMLLTTFRDGVRTGKRQVRPEEVCCDILKELKRRAEAALGQPIYDAVVTIPAYFHEQQRAATLQACRLAGLNVLQLLNEPAAAAMAYRLQELCRPQRNPQIADSRILIFDYGGGTCDVSILKITENELLVEASVGDNELGGSDYDKVIALEWDRQLKASNIFYNREDRVRLRFLAECAKKKISSGENSYTNDYMVSASCTHQRCELTITRETFELKTEHLSRLAMVPVRKCLLEAGVGPQDVQLVVLAGGSSRLPRVQELLREIFPRPTNIYADLDADLAISTGAAIQAAVLTKECEIPLRLQDVTPHSLGVGVVCGVNLLIRNNTPIPVSVTQQFITSKDWQTSFPIKVFQGEDIYVKVNDKLIGEFTVKNITRRPKGETKCDITFHIDINGRLTVTAVEVGRVANNKDMVVPNVGH